MPSKPEHRVGGRKHRGLPRYWRVRKLAGSGETYWHEPAARDREQFPVVRLPFGREFWAAADVKRRALLDCEARNAEMDAWRAGLRGPAGEQHRPGSVNALISKYKKSERWRELAARTRADYEKHLTPIGEKFGLAPAVAFSPRVVAAYRASLTPGRQGNMRLQVLSMLLGYGREIGMVSENAALRHRRFKLAKRDAYWSDDAIATFKGSPKVPATMKLALMLGLWTGQREADVLHMRWTDIKDGWLTLRQRKTGKVVTLPVGKPLADYLAQIQKVGVVILLGERGAPYTTNWFSQSFGRATRAAGLSGLTFLDTRRTAVVNLAEAGATASQISAITGHSFSETQHILNTYWVATRPQARAAIAKLERADRAKKAAQNRNKSPRGPGKGVRAPASDIC